MSRKGIEPGSKNKRILQVSAALALFALPLSSCIIVPVRTPTVIKDASGQKAKLPTAIMVPGTTTREQVEQEYKSFAVETGMPNLFWGRFHKSSWAVAGGMYGGGGGAARTWGSYNLLALFDQSGVLKQFETVPDKDLITRLVAMRKKEVFPALDLSKPIHISATTELPYDDRRLDLELSAAGVEITMQKTYWRKPKQNPPRVVQSIPWDQVAGISVPSWETQSDQVPMQLRFSEKTTFGRKIGFFTKPDVVLTIVRWLEQVKKQDHAI